MAYGPGGVTAPADEDPQQQGAAEGGADADATAGGAKRVPRVLSDSCRVLADIAQPPDLKKAFDASLSILSLQVRLGSAAQQGRRHG